MSDLRVEALRNGLVESVHRVSVAAVDAGGRLLAQSGDPELVTFWRSGAKPFQALPLVRDGAVDALGLSPEELAVACGSHSSEPVHRAVVAGLLRKIGCGEADLVCGPHVPLSAEIAAQVARDGTAMTPVWSNCSGNHAGMLALARFHHWPLLGYHRGDHPVQHRLLDEVAEWTGVERRSIGLGVDGCGTVAYALPLSAMALAYARFGAAGEPLAGWLRGAMVEHPALVAGVGRLCTLLMETLPGRVVAKVGAAGIYCCTLPQLGWGIALKIHDGDGRASAAALVAVIQQVMRYNEGGEANLPDPVLAYAEPPISNTRGVAVGVLKAVGSLRFLV